MELRQLEYVVAVAEELSFTRAAERLRVAQPAVSQQVRRLERELGQQLFDRSERQVRVTAAGEVFLNHASAALAAAGAGVDALRSRDGRLTGVLRVGSVAAPPAWLCERLASFREAHPGVRIVLTSGDPSSLTESVATGAVALALVGTVGERRPAGRSGAPVGRGLAVRSVAEEPLVALVPADHPLAARAEVTLTALGAAGLVTLRPGRGLRAVLDSAFAALGVGPDVVLEVDELATVPHLVAAGAGVAVVPESLAPAPGAAPSLRTLRLVRPALRRSLAMVWRRSGASDPTTAFLALAGLRDGE